MNEPWMVANIRLRAAREVMNETKRLEAQREQTEARKREDVDRELRRAALQAWRL